jgi:general secretion pathway protein H
MRSPLHRQSQRGFTLIELIATITLMALVLTTAPAAYEKIRDAMSFRAAIADSTSALKRARVAAVLRGHPVELAVLLDQHQLQTPGEKTIALDPHIKIDMHGVTSLHNPDLPVFRFYPDGSATGGSLTLTTPTGRAQRIEIDWFTGQLLLSQPVAEAAS